MRFSIAEDVRYTVLLLIWLGDESQIFLISSEDNFPVTVKHKITL